MIHCYFASYIHKLTKYEIADLNSDGHDSLVVATSVAFKTESQQMHEAEFVLVWDMPIITFATGKRAYKR